MIQVTSIAISQGLTYLAIGLGDGTVILYRHLDQSIFSSGSTLTAIPKPRTIHESPAEPITGLGFREPDDEAPNMHLFIVTTNRVLCYQASGRGSGGSPALVDEVGCALGCAAMDWHAKNMLVARDEAVYACGLESRGASYAYEGMVVSSGNDLALTSTQNRTENIRPYPSQLPRDHLAAVLPFRIRGLCNCAEFCS